MTSGKVQTVFGLHVGSDSLSEHTVVKKTDNKDIAQSVFIQ